jgi:hypothetical protein
LTILGITAISFIDTFLGSNRKLRLEHIKQEASLNMIKELITDITFDKITLSQALTRTKLVENKIKNATLKAWIAKELSGYEYDDPALPDYRNVWTEIELTAQLPFGRTQTFPLVFPDGFDKETVELVHTHRITEAIATVEHQIATFESAKAYLHFPTQQLGIFTDLYKENLNRAGGVLISGYRLIGKVNYQNVLEQTKQKLIDTLMELDNEFPDLENDFRASRENSDKIQNIITNHIYGDNATATIAAGATVNQSVTITQLRPEDEEKLKSLGLVQAEINDLKNILQNKATEKKETFVGKVVKWMGSVTASIAGRGLYENIPAITEFVQQIIL